MAMLKPPDEFIPPPVWLCLASLHAGLILAPTIQRLPENGEMTSIYGNLNKFNK